MGANANGATNNETETKELGARAKFRLEPVKMVATTNPKKNPSMSYTRFQGYFDIDWSKDQTVGSILDKGVVRMDDIRNDSEKGYIVVGKDAIKAYEKKEEIEAQKRLEEARKLVAEADAK